MIRDEDESFEGMVNDPRFADDALFVYSELVLDWRGVAECG